MPPHRRSCCKRVGTKGFGTYTCRTCGALSCQLHTALWTEGTFRCYFCFSEMRCLKEPNEILVLRNPKAPRCRLRALIVLDGLYTAGAQRHCAELIETLRDLGYACTVLALEGGGRWANLFLSKAETLVLTRNAVFNWLSLRTSIGYDDFRFVSAHLSIAIEWASKNVPASIRSFAHLHSEPSQHERISPEWICTSLRRFDQVFVPSKSTLQRYVSGDDRELPQDLTRKFRVLPNGFHSPAGKMQFRVRRRRTSSRAIRLAVVSRIDSDKFSIPLFCETVRSLREIYPDLAVRVAGDGECKAELKLSAAAAGIDDVVSFLGFVDRLPTLYKWADVVFLPSKREGMPYVLLECMRWACPLVAPAVGFFKEEISSFGLVQTFEPESSVEAVRAIQNALVSKHTRTMVFDNGRYETTGCNRWIQIVNEAYQLS